MWGDVTVKRNEKLGMCVAVKQRNMKHGGGGRWEEAFAPVLEWGNTQGREFGQGREWRGESMVRKQGEVTVWKADGCVVSRC